jgi:hypothetical protein
MTDTKLYTWPDSKGRYRPMIHVEGGKSRLAISDSCCCRQDGECPEDCNDSVWEDGSRFDTEELAESAILYTCTVYHSFCAGFVRWVGYDGTDFGPWAISCCRETAAPPACPPGTTACDGPETVNCGEAIGASCDDGDCNEYGFGSYHCERYQAVAEAGEDPEIVGECAEGTFCGTDSDSTPCYKIQCFPEFHPDPTWSWVKCDCN